MRVMIADTGLEDRLRALFREHLNLDVPSAETDLLETGLLDSLLIVDLLLHVERQLGRSLPMEELEIEDFRTLTTVAQCIAQKSRVIPQGPPPPQPDPARATE